MIALAQKEILQKTKKKKTQNRWIHLKSIR